MEIKTLVKINRLLTSNGGEVYVVGGPIRDLVLGAKPKDIDFLVRKLSLEEISNILSEIGSSDEVGKSYGIVKSRIDGEEFDFAIPRTKEKKTGSGHKDFKVETDPNAPFVDDLGRRDFTWNAMIMPLNVFIRISNSKSPKESSIEFLSNNKEYDPYNGLEDLLSGKLSTVRDPYDRFSEDLLRIFRAIQFSCRIPLG